MPTWLRARSHRRGHAPHQRRNALIMVVTGLVRVFVWICLLVCFFMGASFAVHLFTSLKFISAISVGAMLLTDWGQVAASLAQLTAADAHSAVSTDFAQIDSDIARLAELEPGPEAARLAAEIRQRLGHG